jgi:nucleoside-diphosphate-sugar epimerase
MAPPTNASVIVTGVTGMVGEGVLLECLADPRIARVLVVARKPTGYAHAKLKELTVPSFLDLSGVENDLSGYDACFYCAGVSSVGMSEEEYTRITYDTTLHFAEVLAKRSPQAAFIYVTGAHTDSTEKGKSMWARVKGRTENALMRLPFRAVYAFRPALMRKTPGQRYIKGYYYLFGWTYPILRALAPSHVSTLQDVARAMIRAAFDGAPKQVLEVPDINALGAAPQTS